MDSDLLKGAKLGTAAFHDVGTGANQIPDMSSFVKTITGETAGSNIVDGVFEICGMIFQFGMSKVPGDLAQVTFNKPFPNRCFAVFTTEGTYSGNPSTSIVTTGVAPDTITKTGFKQRVCDHEGKNVQERIYYLAIGH